MRVINATKAKATLPSLLDDVAAGEEIEITRHGRTVARLIPATRGPVLRGKHRGIAWTSDPGDDLLSTGERWSVEGQ